MTSGEAFRSIGRGCLRHLVANQPAMLAGNGEALHQMRIALRRLRAAISAFSELVADDDSARIASELRRCTRQFGPARDLDVLVAEVLAPLQQHSPDEPGVARLCRNIERRRARAHRKASASVQSSRFRSLILDAAEWIEAGKWARPRMTCRDCDASSPSPPMPPTCSLAGGKNQENDHEDAPGAQCRRAAPIASPRQEAPVHHRVLCRCISREETREPVRGGAGVAEGPPGCARWPQRHHDAREARVPHGDVHSAHVGVTGARAGIRSRDNRRARRRPTWTPCSRPPTRVYGPSRGQTILDLRVRPFGPECRQMVRTPS